MDVNIKNWPYENCNTAPTILDALYSGGGADDGLERRGRGFGASPQPPGGVLFLRARQQPAAVRHLAIPSNAPASTVPPKSRT